MRTPQTVRAWPLALPGKGQLNRCALACGRLRDALLVRKDHRGSFQSVALPEEGNSLITSMALWGLRR